MKYFITLLLPVILFFFTYRGNADPRIDQIIKLYKEVKNLECDSGCEHFRHELTINTMQPATGLQTTTIKFYFNSTQINPEKNPYLFFYDLKIITVDYNISVHEFVHIEYLFGEEGNPVFYFRENKTAEETGTKRFYFDADKVIKVVMDYISPQGERMKYTLDKNFNPGDLSDGQNIIATGINYLKLFNSIIAADKWK